MKRKETGNQQRYLPAIQLEHGGEKEQKLVNSLLVLSFACCGSGTHMGHATLKTADIK